ncbi:hypothetical protein TBLA_0B02280 [Henningerozyma blattae CBS 6284]|uniref:PUM-HD domain-containing protein n=1 Tax=Henningerozyma blattae (strain ATCC 34711 / CBS 6284 / DSM 70876 / NBRC 10599 / NRRL Y-10934 / UCD 77-7) TaxID=1071380 RepID=I2GY68_HENB6|nr:hypothetical protein TBLA_0B02280 [Tetrapisispora blattae CBS 6284]CCH59070.1 hypothetical protein TBLA_0B02280 [Tetrapisispora blattae CBS 6284]
MTTIKKKQNSSKRSLKESKDSKKIKKARISIESSDDDLDFISDEEHANDKDVSEQEEEVNDAKSDEESEDQNDEDSGEESNEDTPTSNDDSNDNHTEQRKLLKERKLQRKSGIQVQQIKQLWEKLRVKSPPIPKEIRNKLCGEIWELSKDCIKDLIMKHDSSRVVQTLVKYCDKERREQIVQSLKGNYYVLATSAYGKYLLVKLLHYGTKDSRQIIIDELHGSLRKLMRHREGAYVVEDLFVLYASHEQKQQMIKEFWGAEYAVFKDSYKNEDIKQVCKNTEKRDIIAKNLIGTISASINKGSTGFQILHAAMREYIKIMNDEECSEMIELLHEQIAELVHTPEGCEVACVLIARGNAKERKSIIRGLKAHGSKLMQNEYGNLILITLFMTVDDTVLMFKTFGPVLKENFVEIICDKYGRRPFLYLLKELNGKYFYPQIKKDLLKYKEMSQSKKDDKQRRLELLDKFGSLILSQLNKNFEDIIENNLGIQMIQEVLQCERIYEEDKIATLIEKIIKTGMKDDSMYCRLLKSLIQGGCWNNQLKQLEPFKKIENLVGVEFGVKLFNEVIEGNILEWIENEDCSFCIVSLYETLHGKKEGEGFEKELKEVDLQNVESKGGKLLLKLMNN